MTSPSPRKEGSDVSPPDPPPLDGLHHLKIPVTDPAAAAGWWERLLGATRVPQWDHVGDDGTLFGVLIQVPGLPVPVELRRAHGSAAAVAGFDPITLAVADRRTLERWAQHAGRLGIANSGVLRGALGWFAAFRTPDGLMLRMHTREQHDWDMAASDLHSPWARPLPRDDWKSTATA
jgi:catechol 2,3-dioxygenase-like lactoylglutathione lyase family enzyme